jgi:glycosyltransferase involved in cell wall biosynthesis
VVARLTRTLTVVIPLYNEETEIGRTIAALEEALAQTSFDVNVVVVDDGSTDGSAAAAAAACRRLPLVLVSQPNSGRLAARRAGLDRAEGEFVLLLDSRVRLRPDALEFVEGRLASGARVWTGHVDVETAGNPYGVFWDVIARRAWSRYFDDPRTVAYGFNDFDHYPKGTGCFFAPRALLQDVHALETTRYADQRHANDDTAILRHLARHEPIWVSPGFRCWYEARQTLPGFVRHVRHRGVVFLDGHGRRDSRFFPIVAAFYPVSVLVAIAVVRRPARVAYPILVASSAGVLLSARDRRLSSAPTLAVLTPVFAAAYGLGMWKGALLALRAKCRAA